MSALVKICSTLMFIPLSSYFSAGQELPSAEKNWDLSVWSSIATGEENTNSFGEAQIVMAGASIGRIIARRDRARWLSGELEYRFSLSPLFLQLRPENLHGIAFEPVIFRWRSSHRLRGSIPYVELAGGGVHTNLNLPAGDTSTFNFTARGGVGLCFRATDISAGWFHISNANLGKRNPEFNGIELRLAYHWFR